MNRINYFVPTPSGPNSFAFGSPPGSVGTSNGPGAKPLFASAAPQFEQCATVTSRSGTGVLNGNCVSFGVILEAPDYIPGTEYEEENNFVVSYEVALGFSANQDVVCGVTVGWYPAGTSVSASSGWSADNTTVTDRLFVPPISFSQNSGCYHAGYSGQVLVPGFTPVAVVTAYISNDSGSDTDLDSIYCSVAAKSHGEVSANFDPYRS